MNPTTTVPETLTTTLPDGTRLVGSLYRAADYETTSVILVRTPYWRREGLSLPEHLTTIDGLNAAGWHVYLQDCRGTGDSTGDFEPLRHETHDGVATLEWVREQPWCDGTVVTLGASYLGFTQFAIATTDASKDLAGSVLINTAADAYSGWIYSKGGAFSIENTDRYGIFCAAGAAQRSGDPARARQLIAAATKTTARLRQGGAPTATLVGSTAPWFGDWVAHPSRDEYWKALSYREDLPATESPSLHIGGWFDFFSDATTDAYTTLRKSARTERARNGQYLVMGPWNHMSFTGEYDAYDFGPTASAAGIGLDHVLERFLHAVAGTAPLSADDAHRVRYFVMGADEWRTAPDWPIPASRPTPFYLAGGVLQTDHPTAEATAEVHHDPANPVPTLGGRLLFAGDTWTASGPADQRINADRDDVLTFTSAPLEAQTTIAGNITATVWVSTDLDDADIALTLADLDEHGAYRLLSEGITRLSSTVPRGTSIAGTQHRVDVDVSVTANEFAVGHRIGLLVSGSNFPRYDLNPAHQAGTITLHTGPTTLSRVTLPVLAPDKESA